VLSDPWFEFEDRSENSVSDSEVATFAARKWSPTFLTLEVEGFKTLESARGFLLFSTVSFVNLQVNLFVLVTNWRRLWATRPLGFDL
jgi:hypothetical protein